MLARFALLLMTVCVGLAHSRNLVQYATFDFDTELVELPPGWNIRGGAPNFTVTHDRSVRYGEHASLRLAAPANTASDTWNMVAYKIRELKRNTPYAISMMVKAQDLGPGALVYASLNCFDGGRIRLAANDSAQKLSAPADWTRLTFVVPQLPSGTAEAELVLCLKGAGTAWYTQLQVEMAPQPTPFQLAPEDQELREALRQQALMRQTWQTKMLARRQHPQREAIAILDMNLPQRPGLAGYPSAPATLQKTLQQHYDTIILTPQELATPGLLNPDIVRLLIVPTGNHFPIPAVKPLQRFLSRGGQLLTCGGYAFDLPVSLINGQWRAANTTPPLSHLTHPVPQPLAPASDWKPSNLPDSPTAIRKVPGSAPDSPAIEIATEQLTAWNTGIMKLDSEKLPPWTALSITVKANTPQTTAAWFEIAEKDGSRWRTKIPLTQEWTQHTLAVDQFSYWHDNPSIGRGTRGDRLNPSQAASLQFGFAIDCATRGSAHAAAIANLTLGTDPHYEQRIIVTPQINTRDGRIRDAIHPTDQQISIFDPAFKLLHVASTRTAPLMSGILPDIQLHEPYAGFAAVAQLCVNGHGFGPNRAAWRPLLETYDAQGLPRGPLGAIVHHFNGSYKGSSWAFFGVDNRDLFADGSPLLQQLLLPAVNILMRRISLNSTTAEYACYRHGETMKLTTQAANFSGKARQGVVRFTLTDERGEHVLRRHVPVTLTAGGNTTVSCTWNIPETAPDYLAITAELLLDDQLVDREDGAVCIWNEQTIANGPVLGREGLRFTLNGRPQFFMGCQTYWGQVQSLTARSPKLFHQDFRQMRAHHLRWTRCFLPFIDEQCRRVSDAIVLLAQKFGLVIYHTPNLANTADAAQLKREEKLIREIAQRYRQVPGFAIDLCNEPALPIVNSSAFDKLLGHQPKLAGPWHDGQVQHTYVTATETQRQWARHLAQAARQERPGTLVSVGWSQGWEDNSKKRTKDPQIASLDLDFTDRHYYGPYARMMPHIKDLDQRVLGKPVIVGECGAKCHPTFLDHDPWGHGNDDDGYSERFRYLVSHAFGNGCAALLSWHWRDPMEGIFPCGLALSTGVPRPTAAIFADMAKTFSQLELVDNPPDTVVLMGDFLRHSTWRAKAIASTHAADQALLWLGANTSKLTEQALPQVLHKTKAIIYPAAFVLSEQTVDLLEQFVRQGGRLWLSGNPQFDSTGKQHPEWLQRLCGVSPAPEGLNAQPHEAASVMRQADGRYAGNTITPVLDVTPNPETEILGTADGKPFLLARRLGKGRVVFCTALLEDNTTIEQPLLRTAYQSFLFEAQASTTRRFRDPETLETFKVPGRGATGWVFWNHGPQEARVERHGHRLLLQPKQAGYLQIADDGSLQISNVW